jgi:hypothetical protein
LLSRDVAQHLVGAVVVEPAAAGLLMVEPLYGAALAAEAEAARAVALQEPLRMAALVLLEQQEPQLLPLQRSPVAVRAVRTTLT